MDEETITRSITSGQFKNWQWGYEALLSLYWFVVPCLDKNFEPTLDLLLLLMLLLLEYHYQIEFPSYQQISTHFMTSFVWTLTIACLFVCSVLTSPLPLITNDDSNWKQMKNWVWHPAIIATKMQFTKVNLFTTKKSILIFQNLK